MVASEREGRFATFAWLAHILFIGKQSVHEHIDLASSERLIDHFRRPINILTLDGGGIRGRCLLTMVEELEETLGAPISHYFDLIGGTSIGGCGALFVCRFTGGDATLKARAAMEALQTRCFSDRSPGRLLRLGHLCADERRAFVLELGGSPSPRLDAIGRRPKAFAVSELEKLKAQVDAHLKALQAPHVLEM